MQNESAYQQAKGLWFRVAEGAGYVKCHRVEASCEYSAKSKGSIALPAESTSAVALCPNRQSLATQP